MVYMGSKKRLLKDLQPILQKCINDNGIQLYVEPFVGGGNVIDSINCKTKIGSDLNSHIITLLKYVQSDNDISIAPAECSFEHYKDVRDSYNNPLLIKNISYY